jgi:hypothetical protein
VSRQEKKLFCKIISRGDYFVLKFVMKVNFVKIVDLKLIAEEIFLKREHSPSSASSDAHIFLLLGIYIFITIMDQEGLIHVSTI